MGAHFFQCKNNNDITMMTAVCIVVVSHKRSPGCNSWFDVTQKMFKLVSGV